MKTKITIRDILKTIHADLIGKDSHRGITLTYGWMANQVGHFALGFIPTFIVYVCIENSVKALISVALFWLAFEIYNASSPLFKKEYKGNGSFKPKWGNLTFDTFTDLCFFWVGGMSLFLLIDFRINLFYILILAFAALFFSIRFWFLTKLYQQNAFFPYQFRLSQWNAPIQKSYISIINTFLKKVPGNKHFLVFGSKGKGKTTLMVGLANEVSIKKKKSTYTTFTKWISMLTEDDATLNSTTNSLWTWTNTDVLLIDDINPGMPVEANKCKASEVYKYIQNNHSERNSKALIETNVAWVVGSCAPNETSEDWVQMLLQLNIKQENIYVIDLDKN